MLTAKLIFLAVSAIALVYLSARYVRRRRAERIAASPVSAPTQPPPLPAAASAARQPAAAQLAIAVPPARNGSDERIAPSEASRAFRNPSWTGRTLFGDGAKATDDGLPHVQPDEIPTADTSRCTFGPATPLLAAFLPESEQRRVVVKKELQAAGYYEPHAWHNLAALRWVLMMGSIVLFGVLLLFVPRWMETPIIAALVTCAIIGWAVPRLMIRGQATQRLSAIERAMPDMLDMLNMSVSQGMTVQESLGRISGQLKSVSPELAQELRIVSEQAAVGSLEQALLNFGNRIDLPEVHSFTTLIIQTERMGTSISDALQQYSDNMRENLRQRADEKANNASFKLLFPTVLFLMPAVFIILLGPAIVELSDFFTGRGRQVLTRNRQAVDDINTRQFPQINP